MRFISYGFALVLLLLSLAGPARSQAAPPAAVSMEYIHSDFAAAIVFNPERIKKSMPFKSFKNALGEEPFESMREELGWDPRNLTQAIILVGPVPTDEKDADSPKTLGVILRFKDPVDPDAVTEKQLLFRAEKASYNGKVYAREPEEYSPKAVYVSDDLRTVLIAPERSLKLMLSAEKTDSPLTKMVAKIDPEKDVVLVAAVEPFRAMAKKLAPMIQQQAPPQVVQLLSMFDELESILAEVDLSGKEMLGINIVCSNDETSIKLKAMASEQLKMLKMLYQLVAVPALKNDTPPEYGKPLLKIGDSLLKSIHLKQDKTAVSLRVTRPEGLEDLPNMLEAAIVSVRESARHTTRQSNFKQLGAAFLIYRTQNAHLPAATTKSKQDKSLLSWRVSMLPYIDQQDLYDQFNLDESWDSKHNIKLLSKMPDMYGMPGAGEENAKGLTRVQMFVGETAMFHGGRTPKFKDEIDFQTIMLVGTGPDKVVPWTKPADVPFDPKDPAKALGELSDQGIMVLFYDGRVRDLPKEIEPKKLKALITSNGGAEVELP